jgi:hypothetical protein
MKQILIVVLLLAYASTNMYAQSDSSPRLTQEYLMSHKWYPDIYDDEDLDTSFITYSLTHEIDSVFSEDGKQTVYMLNYYLSDTKDLIFETDKVGNTLSGKYLILERATETDSILTFILEAVFVSEEKMVLRNWTEGYTTYSHSTTYYTSPIQ